MSGWKILIVISLIIYEVRIASAQVLNACTSCDNYGGFRDPNAEVFTGFTCNMMWVPGIEASDAFQCTSFDQFLIHACCADPPTPRCPICGDGESLTEPDRQITGTGLRCRDLEASAQASTVSGADCGLLRESFSRFCCGSELPVAEYCPTCPNDNVLALVTSRDPSRPCSQIILNQLIETDGTNCATNIERFGCCGNLPNSCNGLSVCGDPALLKPDTLVFSTRFFQEEALPTCAEFLTALSLSPPDQRGCTSLSSAPFNSFGIRTGCCEGAADCSVCIDGGEVEDQNRTLDYVMEGLTCGSVDEALGFLSVQDCGSSFLGFDVHGYCGCPSAQPPPNHCGQLCGSGGVLEPEVVVNGQATCGELQGIAPYLEPDMCGDVAEWRRACACASTSTPTLAPTSVPTESALATLLPTIDFSARLSSGTSEILSFSAGTQGWVLAATLGLAYLVI